MEINRHNYENFFLLWVDGELCPKDQEAVERFIADNPDLAEELMLLQETKLPAEEFISFPNKATLLKNASNAISLSNYETYFLLYIDGELGSADAAAVELFVLQHPSLQSEFLLIQKTKLPPEQVAFPNKELLYKKGKKSTPIFYLHWKKLAVAAALIGLAFSVWMIVPSANTKQSTAIASLVKPVAKVVSNNGMQIDKPQLEVLTNAAHERISKTNNLLGTSKYINSATNSVINTAPNSLPNNQETVVAINNGTLANNSNLSNTIDLDKTISSNNVAEETVTKNTVLFNSHSEKNTLLTAAEQEDDHANLIKTTVYKELDTDEISSSVYIGNLEINKDKFRGIFRKAGSLFRSKSKLEEEKIDTNK